ncbi:Aste57867_22691 [Aphanomyces stellatus]|uniref:Aste57867_22691 protein n=1 Tax=Aphanomyces stellatus TaxID=120398 RepID=A0A485LLI7_9STRA|nr:hypothetical protein As57867_022621 [Aphanomyces stellatus]VFT99345.1 Aste57867_22691 [Aphanomyces stellatus]
MAASYHVLATPDIIRLILPFQKGYTYDMAALASLGSRSAKKSPEDAARILTSWFAQFDDFTTRLPVAFRTFPKLKLPLVQYASSHGRVDVLQVVHAYYLSAGLAQCPTSHLEESAASGGHLAVLEYLDSIGSKRKKWFQCTSLAAAQGHVPVLQYLQDTQPLDKWLKKAIVTKAIDDNQPEAFAFLYKAWATLTPANDDNRYHIQCLDLVVTKAGSTDYSSTWLPTMTWIVPAMRQLNHSDALINVLLTNRSSKVLVEFLDASFHVPLRYIAIAANSRQIEGAYLSRLFDTLPWLREPGPARDDTMKQYFVDAIHMVNLPIMQWLAKAMDRTVVREVLQSNQYGLEYAIQTCKLEIVQFYDTFGVPISDALVQKAIDLDWTRFHLVKHVLQDPTAKLDPWYTWLVGRYGGRVAVMRYLIDNAEPDKVLLYDLTALQQAWKAEAEKETPAPTGSTIADIWSNLGPKVLLEPKRKSCADDDDATSGQTNPSPATRIPKLKRKTRFTRPQPSTVYLAKQVAKLPFTRVEPTPDRIGTDDRAEEVDQSSDRLASLALV